MAEQAPSSQLSQPSPNKPPRSRAGFEESGRPGKRPRLSTPPQMTAAVAHAEERQQQRSPAASFQSPNPQAEAIGALMGVAQNATSPATENASQIANSNPATTLSQPLNIVAQNLQTPPGTASTQGDAITQTSPVSASSLGTINSIIGPSGAVTAIGSPQPMDGIIKSASGNDSVSPEDPNKSMSYPTSFLQPQNDGRRGMSLPHSGLRQGTRSPSGSNKKHKCPYCSTEFTRHHNLKSHLLTHSQEKPYVCATCNSRFRRLHDLKRHTKLHTGERPHVCPKCNRKFARGDALARHNKGPGGCAGRRESMGSFAGDDDGDVDEAMESVVYGEPENMEDDDGTMRGTPQIRRQPPSGDDSVDTTANYRMPSTYPPIQGRPPGSFPPPTGYGASNQPYAASGAQYSGASSGMRPGSQVFAQNPMTESPKPISPAQRQNTGTIDSIGRNRSPSNPQYAQHPQQYPPRGSSGSSSLAVPPHGPQLPPPHGLNPPDPRFTLPSQAGPTHPPTQPSGPPTHMSGSGPLSSHSNSSSHGFSGHGSGEGHKGAFPTNEERLWAVVRSLENQMGSMRETIDSLRAEVANLKQKAEQQHRTQT
ncbi:hypothetical protein H2198_001429 [Neophaeococcomyces mojaviensis]|uniref:Uncharacterized protein n=1 Tax=Neophaeococcomyces mojaviensis TaxID=3383035 RepID=A0ACC3AGV7_9EURO|nr:hypothetical protein H2198_001429 [Knufia sp. JES_112]